MRKLPFKRSARIAGEIYQLIAEVCRNRLSDPRVQGIQITDVQMTDDLQIVKVYYYVDGISGIRKRAREGLEKASGVFKRVMAEQLDLRLVPELRFYFDETIEQGEKMDKILNDLRQNGQMGEDDGDVGEL